MLLKKIKWISGIMLVFFVILATNLIDKRNFEELQRSVVSIYEDRLIAKGYLFEISTLTQEKDIANALSDAAFYNQRNTKVNDRITSLIESFEMTELTRNETYILNDLKTSFEDIKALEGELLITSFDSNNSIMELALTELKLHLKDLSKVQLEEGRREMIRSKQTIETVELFTNMEIYFLIFMAVLIQIIILYSPKKSGVKID